ncbi:hypothetical protein [Myroides sp. WP-1]|uniref:hypothetical protein n=1 Tax=Myroides sp. WP-1 TaxID=2759944 RepID=UPI0015F8453E|nr:hypothetical protein [Myroides sp. WP-1]MBB1138504.1 hypothetical protein [Myroides sp. WP-1]
MKRIYSILMGISILAVGGGLVTSCNSSDNSDFSSDPNYKGPTFVSLTLPDTTRIEKENFIARLDVNGEFTLLLDRIDNGNEKFEFKVLRFQEGNFPTNLNPMTYLLRTGEGSYDAFSSLDMMDPKKNNGMIKITKIDKEAMLVSGSYSSLVNPSPTNTALLRSFNISGEFKNIPYKRVGVQSEFGFVYATLDNREMKDLLVISNPKGDIQKGRAVIKAESSSLRKRIIEISFPKEAGVGAYGYDQVDVVYTSENGVKYYSDAAAKDLVGSSFRIESMESNIVTNRTTFIGKFLFKLKSKEGSVITLEFGDFNARLLMKESVTTPNPDPGTGGPIEL